MLGELKGEIVVIDTMVFAYALLGVEEGEEALAILEKTKTVIVPDSFRAEFANVLWQWVRFRQVSEEVACAAMERTEVLIDIVVGSEEVWLSALQLAIASNHPVYDALFVATAMMQDEKVVTYDKKLQSKFPDRVLSPQAFLAL